MKREILFKAKRSDGKGWVQGDLVTDGKYSKNNLLWIFPDNAEEYDFSLLLKVIPETVCQYISSFKVFEGDWALLSTEESYDNGNSIWHDGFKDLKAYVCYYCDSWCFKTECGEIIPFYEIDYAEITFELTGKNIHDE